MNGGNIVNDKFIKLLEDAVTNDTSLILILEKIKPMINKLSRTKNGKIDEDLKSILVTYSIEIIRKKKIFKIF